MKYIFTILILTLSLNADSIFNGKCVSNFYTLDSTTLKIEYTNGGNSTVTESKAKLEELVSNLNQFELVDGKCQLIGANLGMNSSDYNFIMGLLGGLYGLTVLFMLVRIL